MKKHILAPLLGRFEKEYLLNYMKEMGDHPSPTPLQLFISSPGGSIPHAFAFYNLIAHEKRELTTIGSGQICAASLIVWLAGTKRLLMPYTFIFFHEMRFDDTEVGFDFSELKARQNYKTTGEGYLLEIMQLKLGRESKAKECPAFMKDATVLTPKQAVECGLAHGILD